MLTTLGPAAGQLFCGECWRQIGAFYADRLGALVMAFAKINSLMGGIILGIFLLGILSRRATGTGVILGAMVSLALVIYISLYTPVTLYWYCIIGGVATLVTGWLFSLHSLPARDKEN